MYITILSILTISEFWKDKKMSLPRPIKFDLDENDSTKTCDFNPIDIAWIKLFNISTDEAGINTFITEYRSVLPFLIMNIFLNLLLLVNIACDVDWYTIGIISIDTI